MDINVIIWIISILLGSLIVALGVVGAVLNHHLDRICSKLVVIDHDLARIANIQITKQNMLFCLEQYFEEHHYSDFERKEILDYISKGG